MDMAEGMDPPAMDAGAVAREDGRACVVDVRPASSHRAEHIAGARSVPFAQLEGRLAELPAGAVLVFYCT